MASGLFLLMIFFAVFLGLFFFFFGDFWKKTKNQRTERRQKEEDPKIKKRHQDNRKAKKLWKTERPKKETLAVFRYNVLVRRCGLGLFSWCRPSTPRAAAVFQRRASTFAEWPFSLVSRFDAVLLPLFLGSSSSPRLGPVLRCRGPLSWSGAVILASSWCRRSVSRPGPVLCRHGPASWFGSLSWCCSAILWFPGVVVGVVVVRGQGAVLGMVSGMVRV